MNRWFLGSKFVDCDLLEAELFASISILITTRNNMRDHPNFSGTFGRIILLPIRNQYGGIVELHCIRINLRPFGLTDKQGKL